MIFELNRMNGAGQASQNWEQFAREARVDHLAIESICILACHEYEQNGPSEIAE